jgi:Ca2+-binding RTX toxin-like protein
VNLQQPGNVTGSVGVIGNFAALESVIGGQGDDTFLFLTGGSTSGGIDGGPGNNSLDYRGFTPATSTGVTVNLITGAASQIYGGASGRVSRIRDVYGTSKNDNISGDAQNNIFYGLGGNDNLVGNDGNDMLIGGMGSDTVQGGNGYNIVTGAEINFTIGGTSAGGYGIAGQYYDYVLRGMMNVLSTAVDGTTANSAYNNIESSGVNVQVPGTAGTVGAVRLFAELTSTVGSNGTVFNDAIFDRVVITGNMTDFVFYTATPSTPSESDLVVNLSKARRAVIANRRI